MIISNAQRVLLATDSWPWLAGFVDRWYADPLAANDGSSTEDIAAAAAKIGGDLPAGLVEWFTLVGRRLRTVQDAPATPDTLRGNGGGVMVWGENQGVWSMVARPDGTCVVDNVLDCEDFNVGFPFPPTPLSQALQGMLLSDTLFGACAGSGNGPLGRLAPGVRGGTVDADAEVAAALTAYPELAVPSHPFWSTPPRGDADTALRGGDNEAGLQWMTASRTAFDRLAGLVALDPPGGPQEIVVAFEELSPAERTILIDDQDDLDMKRFATAVQGLGRLWMGAADTATGARFLIKTSRPDETIAALRGAVPPELAGKVVVAIRPERISSFRVVHPAGRSEYHLPDAGSY